MLLQFCVRFISKFQPLQRRRCREIPEMSCLVFLTPSACLLRKCVIEIRVFFFIVLIYLPRMTDLPALPNMRAAVPSISIC